MKKFTDIKIGDIVKVYDEHARQYVTHRIKINDVKRNGAYIEKALNPLGYRFIGEDLDYSYNKNDPHYISVVTERNFIDIISSSDKYMLTEDGEEKIRSYIATCNAKKKEILESDLDTANEVNIPTMEDIINDLNFGVGIDSDGDYYNRWGITDNYDSDEPLCLWNDEDFIEKK